MGLISASLQIGRSALLSSQSALQVIGNNVANAANPDHTRQAVRLSSLTGTPLAEGLQPGAGVTLVAMKRNLDEGLEARLRAATGDRTSAEAQRQLLSRLEILFDESDGTGVSSVMNEFFNNLSAVQNNPSDLGVRTVAVASGAELARTLQRVREELIATGQEVDGQIAAVVQQVDALATEVAELNAEIVAAEAGAAAPAAVLRDRRDARLRDMAALVDVSVRHQPDGAINVYIGSEPLVQGGLSRGLTSQEDVDGTFIRTTVRFADTNSRITLRGGELGGLIAARDTHAYGRVADIDTLAAGVILEVNRVHADGQGMRGFAEVTGANAVDATDVVLNLADSGLDPPPEHGSFFIAVTDVASGTTVAHQIRVDLDGEGTDTTLDTLAADITAAVEGVTATVTADHRLSLEAAPGTTFTFGHDGESFRQDTSGVLAALGVNTFFTGRDATDIAVNSVLERDPGALAAATLNLSGDGTNAGNLAGVANAASAFLGGASVVEQYNRVANAVAVDSAAARTGADAAEAVQTALQTQKDSISGVSLDEEAIELLKFERAFQAAARYVSLVDRLLNEMMELVN